MSGLESLYDSPQLFIGYDQPNEWIFVEWRGYHDGTSVRAGCGLLLDYVKAKQCAKVLTTDTFTNSRGGLVSGGQFHDSTPSSWESAAGWLGNKFYQQLTAAGLQFLAWVNSNSYVDRRAANAALAVSEALQFNEGRLLIVTFDDLATAYEWLQNRRTRRHAPAAEVAMFSLMLH